MKDITIIGGDGISRMLACCPDLADRQADPLLKCIGKIRDLSARRTLVKKEFRHYLASSVGLTPKQSIEVFASPIVADGTTKTSGISSECIVWFNRQASIWPVEKLVVESWWRFACAIDSFMAATQLGITRRSTGPARKAAQPS